MDQMPRDRLRELLDAVLDDDHASLTQMAGGAYASPHHFTRQVSGAASEPPVAMRRRVMLERAGWRLARGGSVTDAAFEAGYESVEGFARAFARAFGHPPSRTRPGADHWLPAPNGIHFHAPSSLWVDAGEQVADPLTEVLVRHDLDDVTLLLEAAKGLPEEDLRRPVLPGTTLLEWSGPEESLLAVLTRLVGTKEVWLASIRGEDWPAGQGGTAGEERELDGLAERHDAVAADWLALVRDLERRGGWHDRLVDALCDPPESFTMVSVVAHVLTYSTARRQLARLMLRRLGHPAADQGVGGVGDGVGDGDPIMWLRSRAAGREEER